MVHFEKNDKKIRLVKYLGKLLVEVKEGGENYYSGILGLSFYTRPIFQVLNKKKKKKKKIGPQNQNARLIKKQPEALLFVLHELKRTCRFHF